MSTKEFENAFVYTFSLYIFLATVEICINFSFLFQMNRTEIAFLSKLHIKKIKFASTIIWI